MQYKDLTEFEIQTIIEGRKILFHSAKMSYHVNGVERHNWINDERIIELAKKFNIEDELIYIANYVWGE